MIAGVILPPVTPLRAALAAAQLRGMLTQLKGRRLVLAPRELAGYTTIDPDWLERHGVRTAPEVA